MAELFDKDNQDSSQTNDEPQEGQSYAEYFIGEGKKYATQEDAMKALYHSQNYIPQLEDENKGMRNDLNSRLALEELVNKLENGASNHSDNQSDNDERHNESNLPDVNGLSKEEVAQMVKELLTEDKTRSQYERNVDSCVEQLNKMYGSAYRSVVNDVAKNTGMTQEALTEMAGKYPQAFIKLVSDSSPDGKQNATNINQGIPPTTSVNTTARPRSNGKDWAYYENVRKTNPGTYWSIQFQKQMREAAERGEFVPGE